MCKTWTLDLLCNGKLKRGGVGAKKTTFDFRKPMGLLDIVVKLPIMVLDIDRDLIGGNGSGNPEIEKARARISP